MEDKPNKFTFAISLSVLDHLGRKLYRSFSTILGEGISNAWDADADDVWIYVDKENNSFFIKDNGEGMDFYDFQNKFLKVGYSKRKAEGKSVSKRGRPFIGRKGIGKLALLSCADKVHVISKKEGSDYVGGIIDNSKLDNAITDDLEPQQYPLEKVDMSIFEKYTKDHNKGTIIYFDNLRKEIRNSLKFLRKTIALYFRFSLHDDFNIFLEDELITTADLNDLAEKTEFVWKINDFEDPYIKKLETLSSLKEKSFIKMDGKVRGFIASVIMPRYLNIATTEGRVGVDLFVNGRLRETNILKHIPTARVPEDYLYGQIHVDDLDEGEDKFTSSREGIVADDEDYQKFLASLKERIHKILEDWDEWRRQHREDGDPENLTKITKKDRRSEELFNAVSEDYRVEKKDEDPKDKNEIDKWVKDLGNDAAYNFTSYAECFISENLVRKHIQEKNVTLSPEAITEINNWKNKETLNKNSGNVNIDIRKIPNDTSYLSMDGLSNLVDKSRDNNKDPGLSRDAKEYKPIRDALMHTALLTDEAKRKLASVRENIRARVKSLLSDD